MNKARILDYFFELDSEDSAQKEIINAKNNKCQEICSSLDELRLEKYVSLIYKTYLDRFMKLSCTKYNIYQFENQYYKYTTSLEYVNNDIVLKNQLVNKSLNDINTIYITKQKDIARFIYKNIYLENSELRNCSEILEPESKTK